VLKDTAPRHVEYTLTELGETLREPLAAICAWATEHA
jgi:DNA-binding HxlR family transcriptional regulator